MIATSSRVAGGRSGQAGCDCRDYLEKGERVGRFVILRDMDGRTHAIAPEVHRGDLRNRQELVQRGCIDEHGRLRGKRFGDFEELNLGNTSVHELKSVGLDIVIPNSITFNSSPIINAEEARKCDA